MLEERLENKTVEHHVSRKRHEQGTVVPRPDTCSEEQ